MRSLLMQLTMVSILLPVASAANGFENLDFEQAMPVITGEPHDCCAQPVGSILPHWKAVNLFGFDFRIPNPDPMGFMYYNAVHIGTTPIFNVIDSGVASIAPELMPDAPISGNYSLQIDARGSGGELSQVGTVPANSKSIRFLGSFLDYFPDSFPAPAKLPISDLDLFLGDTKLNVIELSTFQSHNAYGANIPTSLQGVETELRFTIFSDDIFGSKSLTLDDISFSPIAVPEPSTMVSIAISLCACLGLGRTRG